MMEPQFEESTDDWILVDFQRDAQEGDVVLCEASETSESVDIEDLDEREEYEKNSDTITTSTQKNVYIPGFSSKKVVARKTKRIQRVYNRKTGEFIKKSLFIMNTPKFATF